ncbi:MAG: orotate phosphoribosyltransferase [Thermococci archaeon]|nr:orotate phosphoribosyltransferase [Thermococci archaeon]
MNEENKRRLIEAFIERKAILFGDFTLTSGKKSRYYINVKRLITEPEILRLISDMILERTGEMKLKFDRVAGPELGAVPIATAVSLTSGKPLVIIRKKPKGHGTGSLIEGEVEDGDDVLIVEDVTTTGKSVLRSADVIRSLGGNVAAICTVVDREEGAEEEIKGRGYRFISLLRVSELMERAPEKELLAQDS